MWQRPPSSAEPPAQAPLVTDRRHTPRGVMPRHLQTWVMVGTAIVMMGILAITGRSTPPRPTANTSAGAMAVDPNLQRIEAYQARIQEQAQRLAAEQAELQVAKQTLGEVPERPAVPVESTGAATRTTTTTDTLHHERLQREYRSFFADNLAVSRPSHIDASSSVAPINPSSVAESPSADTASPSVPAAPSVRNPVAFADTAQGARLDHPKVVPTADRVPMGAPSTEPTYRLTEGTLIETVLTNRLDGTYAGSGELPRHVPVYADGSPASGDSRRRARARGGARGEHLWSVAARRRLSPRDPAEWRPASIWTTSRAQPDRGPGLRDQVDRHYAQIFGVSLAIGAIAGFAQAQSTGRSGRDGPRCVSTGGRRPVSRSRARGFSIAF